MLKNSLFSPLCSAPFFCFSLFFLFFFFLFSTTHLFFFSVSCFPRCCYAPALFYFSFCVLPFIFQPKILLFQPKRFSAQKHFFQPKTFLLQPKTFFNSAQNVFLFFFYFLFFYFFSSATLLFFFFSALFFSGSALFFFLFQRLFFSSLFLVSHAAVLLQPSFPFLFVYCPLFFRPKYFCFPRCYFSQPTPFGILS